MLFVAREVDYARYLLEFERTIDSRIASYRIVSYHTTTILAQSTKTLRVTHSDCEIMPLDSLVVKFII